MLACLCRPPVSHVFQLQLEKHDRHVCHSVATRKKSQKNKQITSPRHPSPLPTHTEIKILATFGCVLSPSPRYSSGRGDEEVVSGADKAFIAVTFRKDKRQSVTMMRMPFANVAKRRRVSSDTASHCHNISPPVTRFSFLFFFPKFLVSCKSFHDEETLKRNYDRGCLHSAATTCKLFVESPNKPTHTHFLISTHNVKCHF